MIKGEIMKRFILFVMGFSFLFLSCVTKPNLPAPTFDVSITSENNTELVEINVATDWQSKGIFIDEGINGFDISITNRTDKIIRIVWEKSSLTYYGNSYTPFIEGQKYSNSSEPMAPTVIPANGQIGKSVFSSGQPYYKSGEYGGWRMRTINAPVILIVLCIESGEIEDYFTATIKKIYN